MMELSRLESILVSALELPAGERDAFLERVCGGDAGLRQEVERLLAVQPELGGFLEPPASPAAAQAAPRAVDDTVTQAADTPHGTPAAAADPDSFELAADLIAGRYRILAQIGEGGMGTVYRAEQLEPVHREVALKIIKPGLDSRQVIARFEQERQALALMDHPNIAKVLDGGTTDPPLAPLGGEGSGVRGCGRPFFVMELVKGLPITQYCDEHGLTPRERLELFLPVCHAVQHAHQKGVIHRDLKPSNVLVTQYDDPLPPGGEGRVRGVPKVIDFGVAKATGPKLTDRTMCTEFGALIGTVEYMSPEQASFNALDVDTRSDIYTLGVLLYELLAGTTPFEKQRLRAAALDEVLRIIREEEPPKPSTRLSSCETLASVAANRNLEPKKLTGMVRGELDWIVMKALEKDRSRRYETANGFAMDVQRYLADEAVQACPPSAGYRLRKFARRNKGLVLALCAILFALSVGVIATAWQAARAERERALAIDERNAKQTALASETTARKQAMLALRSLTDDVVERLFSRQAALGDDDRRFLRKIMAQYEAFAAMRGEGEESRAIRAEGEFRVGFLRMKVGESAEARPSFERSRELFGQLAADFPGVPDYRQNLAGIRANLGVLLAEADAHAEAEAEYRSALALDHQLAADYPEVPAYRDDLAGVHLRLGNLLNKLGQLADAETELRRCLALRQELVAGFPGAPDYRKGLAVCHEVLALVLDKLGRRPQAEAEHRQALALFERLVADFPTVPGYRLNLAESHGNLGLWLASLSRRDEAAAQYRQALVLLNRLAADFPVVPLYRADLARGHVALGNLLMGLGKYADAEAEYGQAVALQRRLAADFPAVPAYRRGLAESLHNLGLVLQKWKKPAGAEAQFREALALQERLAADSPAVPEYRMNLADSHNALGLALKQLGKPADAEAEYRQALDVQRQLVAEYPAVADYAVRLGGSYCNFGNLVRDGGKPAEALAWYQQAIGTLAPVVDREPRLAGARAFLRNNHWGRATALMALQRFAQAVEDWDRVIELSDGAERNQFRMRRAVCLTLVEPAKALVAAEELIGADGIPVALLYDAARVFAQSSAQAKETGQREKHVRVALALLRQADKGGYFQDPANRRRLTKDDAFDPLRPRDDFRKLVAELDGKKE